jgi:hypothetical protein
MRLSSTWWSSALALVLALVLVLVLVLQQE